jgi:uracil phosphoribosyltransferase
MSNHVTVIDHPLVLHKLSLMRDKETPSAVFRKLLNEISLLLAYEVLHDLPMETRKIETPITEMDAPFLSGKKLCFVSILRAGNGLLAGMMDLVPSARVGHIGLYRDPSTLAAVEYYMKLPDEIDQRPVVLVDPMLATGNSVSAAIDRLKQAGAKDIRFVCLLAAPEGMAEVTGSNPVGCANHCTWCALRYVACFQSMIATSAIDEISMKANMERTSARQP